MRILGIESSCDETAAAVVEDGERVLSVKWRTHYAEKIKEFRARQGTDGQRRPADVLSFMIHNGVLIHDDLELKMGTPGKDPEGPGPGPLYLQDHGNPVHFRNIWVVKK